MKRYTLYSLFEVRGAEFMENGKDRNGFRAQASGAQIRSAAASAAIYAGVAGLVCALLSLLPRDGKYFSLRFGELLLIASVVYFGFAWLGYLRRDGLLLKAPGRGSNKKEQTGPDWADRIPALGNPPSPVASIPGPEGPDTEEYRALVEAEEKLRARIRGEAEGQDIDAKQPTKVAANIKSAPLALAGIALCAIGIVLQYWVKF